MTTIMTPETQNQIQILGSSTFQYRYYMTNDFTAQEVVIFFKANRLEYHRYSEDYKGVQELFDLFDFCLDRIHTSTSPGRNAMASQVGSLISKAGVWLNELYEVGSGFAEASCAFSRRYPEARRLYENEGDSRWKH